MLILKKPKQGYMNTMLTYPTSRKLVITQINNNNCKIYKQFYFNL